MSPAFTTAVSGIAAASARFERAGADLTRNPAERGADPIAATVDLLTAKTDFKANIALARAADDLLGQTLDLLA